MSNIKETNMLSNMKHCIFIKAKFPITKFPILFRYEIFQSHLGGPIEIHLRLLNLPASEVVLQFISKWLIGNERLTVIKCQRTMLNPSKRQQGSAYWVKVRVTNSQQQEG
jgi:hypothetical protein